jgi:hypothetical protein
MWDYWDNVRNAGFSTISMNKARLNLFLIVWQLLAQKC